MRRNLDRLVVEAVVILVIYLHSLRTPKDRAMHPNVGLSFKRSEIAVRNPCPSVASA